MNAPTDRMNEYIIFYLLERVEKNYLFLAKKFVKRSLTEYL